MNEEVIHGPHFAAPEIDPSSMISGIGLLVGGLAMIRGLRSK